MHTTKGLVGIALVMCWGCSSASFQTTTDDSGTGGSDSGVTDSGATTSPTGTGGDASTEAGPDALPPPVDAPVEIGTGEVGPSCPPLGSSPTDIYVNKVGFTGVANGTSACPFRTITAGLAVAGTFSSVKTVHVAGGGPSMLRYDEASSITVPNGLTLQGDGSASTGIRGSGSCPNGINCAVVVNAGGTLVGFRVENSSGSAIVTGDSFPAPTIKEVIVTGTKSYGLYAVSSANLGPGFVANANGADGVYSPGTGAIHVFGGGAGNVFSGNGANGINMNGQAVLTLEEGSATDNAFNGVRFGALSSPSPGSLGSSIANLTAHSNKNNGLAVYGAQTLKLRGSTLVSNTNVGLFYAWPPGPAPALATLDIGSTTDPGNNVFGGSTKVNEKAGIYLCRPAIDLVAGEGDSWATCAPTQQSLAGCDTLPSSYVDIAYAPGFSAGGNPVVATTCNVGP